jgi:hypothetical protein
MLLTAKFAQIANESKTNHRNAPGIPTTIKRIFIYVFALFAGFLGDLCD